MKLQTALASACCLMFASAAPSIASGPPQGLWAWQQLDHDGTVEISLERSPSGWTAIIDGTPADVRAQSDGSIIVSAPSGEQWRGKVSNESTAIEGQWIQPASALGYQRISTLTIIPAVSKGAWAARIAVQPRPYHVFLDVFSDDQGQHRAVIRNPEFNDVLGSTQYRVEPRESGGWSLVAGKGDNRIAHNLSANAEGRLLLDHDRFDEPLVLSPVDDHADYRASPQFASERRYVEPSLLDDGWVVLQAEEAGFDRRALDAMVAELAGSDPRNPRPRLLHSLLVAHRGKLVVEEYFYGHGRTKRHDTRSLSKVFAPVLIGALQMRGVQIDAETRPLRAVLEAASQTLDDPRKEDITLGQLMSFTSGLDCSEDSTSPGSEERMWEQNEEPDYWLYTAKLPMLHDPGTRYAYCSGSINLVGSALRRAGGKPIQRLFDELIAQPLRFGPYHWPLAPNDRGYLGGGVYMQPRDILKIGAAYANGGEWNGVRIASPEWVARSTSAVIPITPATTGLSDDEFANNYVGGQAALEWRRDSIEVSGTSYEAYEASGNGGQVLIVVPELELSVLFTGGNYRHGGVWNRWRDEIVGGHIIPALIGSQPGGGDALWSHYSEGQ